MREAGNRVEQDIDALAQADLAQKDKFQLGLRWLRKANAFCKIRNSIWHYDELVGRNANEFNKCPSIEISKHDDA